MMATMAPINTWQLLGTLAMTGLAICLFGVRYRQVVKRLRLRLEIRHAEHERIARELNDALLQGMQALVLHFHAIAEKLPEGDPVRASIDQALTLAEDVLIDGRDRIHDLRISEAELAKIIK
jgi:signal transduction histidine kinase